MTGTGRGHSVVPKHITSKRAGNRASVHHVAASAVGLAAVSEFVLALPAALMRRPWFGHEVPAAPGEPRAPPDLLKTGSRRPARLQAAATGCCRWRLPSQPA